MRKFEQEVPEERELPQAEVIKIARGLGRSQIVGRHPSGLPITERAQELDAIIRRNEEVNKMRQEGKEE